MDYIHELEDEGQFDSHGSFTLNLTDSRSRFATLIKQEPAAYLRLWLQALVASQAQEVRLRGSGSTLTISWSGGPPEVWTAADLDALEGYLKGQRDTFRHPAMQYAKLSLALASCQDGLRCQLRPPAAAWALEADASGVRRVQTSGQWDGLRLQKSGSAQVGMDWLAADWLSPLLSYRWPELVQLKPQLHTLPLETRLNGRHLGPPPSWNQDPTNPEILRIHFRHPDPQRNTLRPPRGGPPGPLRWLQPLPELNLSLKGEGMERGPRCYASVRVFLGDLNASPRFLLSKHGFPLQLPQQFVPGRVMLALDASELSTDIAVKKPVRNDALRAKILEARELLGVAITAGLKSVREAPLWQAFLLGSRRESLTEVEGLLRRDWEKLLERVPEA